MATYGTPPQVGTDGSNASSRAISRLADALDAERDELVEVGTQRILAEVPGYRGLSGNATLVDDVRAHVGEHLGRIITWLQTEDPVVPEDLMFIRPHAAQRVGRVTVADFTQAFLLGQTLLWEAVRRLAPGRASQAAAVELFGRVSGYFRVATTVGAEVYLEAEQMLAGTGEQVRRDLLEDLLGRRYPAPGPRLEAARSAGLDEGRLVLVLAATPAAHIVDQHALRAASSALARATRARLLPLTVLRQGEIVIVAPVGADQTGCPGGHAAAFCSQMLEAQQVLAARGLPLTIGISTPHVAFAEIVEAYREACDARDSLLPKPGVLSLSSLSAFEYLTTHADPTARRLVSAPVAEFIDDEMSAGGALIETLRAYAAANMSTKQTAELLHVHVNTVHYRLTKIAERTGCDLRSVNSVIELLIAARLVEGPSHLDAEPGAGAAGSRLPQPPCTRSRQADEPRRLVAARRP